MPHVHIEMISVTVVLLYSEREFVENRVEKKSNLSIAFLMHLEKTQDLTVVAAQIIALLSQPVCFSKDPSSQ